MKRIFNLWKNKCDHLRYWFDTHNIRPCRYVVEIGCGKRRQTIIRSDHYRCFDPTITGTGWKEAIEYIRSLQMPVTVVLFDVIEHLEKPDAVYLLSETVKVAERVIVFTPFGFLEQRDGEYNTHRSGWFPEDFAGWDVIVYPHFHWCDFKGNAYPEPEGAILAVYEKVSEW